MIKINLLPDEFKRTQKPKASFEFKMPEFGPKAIKIAVISLSILIGFHILLVISIFLKDSSLKKLDSKWSSLQPQKIEIDRLNSEITAVEKTVLPIKQLVEKRFLWSKKLNQLSDLMTPGIWFTRLSIEIQVKDAQKGDYIRILNLEGCAASLYGDETALVGKFIKALQEDKDFFQHFSEVKLGPMQKAMIEKNEIMNFKVFCIFRKD